MIGVVGTILINLGTIGLCVFILVRSIKHIYEKKLAKERAEAEHLVRSLLIGRVNPIALFTRTSIDWSLVRRTLIRVEIHHGIARLHFSDNSEPFDLVPSEMRNDE